MLYLVFTIFHACVESISIAHTLNEPFYTFHGHYSRMSSLSRYYSFCRCRSRQINRQEVSHSHRHPRKIYCTLKFAYFFSTSLQSANENKCDARCG